MPNTTTPSPRPRTCSPPTPTTSQYWTHQNGVATGPKPLRLSIPNVNTSTTCSPSTTTTTPGRCYASPPGPTTTPDTTPTKCCGAGATIPTWRAKTTDPPAAGPWYCCTNPTTDPPPSRHGSHTHPGPSPSSAPGTNPCPTHPPTTSTPWTSTRTTCWNWPSKCAPSTTRNWPHCPDAPPNSPWNCDRSTDEQTQPQHNSTVTTLPSATM